VCLDGVVGFLHTGLSKKRRTALGGGGKALVTKKKKMDQKGNTDVAGRRRTEVDGK